MENAGNESMDRPVYDVPPAGQDARPATRWDRATVYACMGLMLATMLAFLPVLSCDFVTWDDPVWIGENPAIVPAPTVAGLTKMWCDAWDGGGVFKNLYTPLTHTVWWVVAKAGQGGAEDINFNTVVQARLDPRAFHVTSLLGHVTVAIVALLLVRRILVRAGGRRGALAGAMAAGGLVALHPINVETVAWASMLKDVLAGLWMTTGLIAVCAAVESAERGESGGRAWWGGGWKWGWGWVGVCFALAVLSKPVAMVFPLLAGVMVAGVYGWRRTAGGAARRGVWRAVAVGLVVSVGVGVATSRWQPAVLKIDPAPEAYRPLVATTVLGRYVGKVFWPTDLTIDYSLPTGVLVREGAWVPWTGLVVAMLAMLLWWRDGTALAGAAMFVVALGPMLGLRDFDFAAISVVADHYAYTAMVGAGLVLGRTVQVALAWAGRGADGRGAKVPGRASATAVSSDRAGVGAAPARGGGGAMAAGVSGVLVAVGVVGGVVLGVLTWRQAGTWHDSAALYRHGLAINPGGLVLNANYAEHLARRKDFAGSRRYAEVAIGRYPGYAQANLLAAQASAMMGDLPAAVRYYDVALPGYATHPGAWVQAADAYAELGMLEKARAYYRQALRLKPDLEPAARMLARVEAELARRDAAGPRPGTTPPGPPETRPMRPPPATQIATPPAPAAR